MSNKFGNALCKKESGFTLIEVLVALLVLSIGLLGVAAMQLKALQGSKTAYDRSIASLMAIDASELLWSRLGAECPSSDPSAANDLQDVIDLWIVDRDVWTNKLPGSSTNSTIEEGEEDCTYIVKVVWDDERFVGESVSSLNYYVRLLDKSG